jgi:hypothetical protein
MLDVMVTGATVCFVRDRSIVNLLRDSSYRFTKIVAAKMTALVCAGSFKPAFSPAAAEARSGREPAYCEALRISTILSTYMHHWRQQGMRGGRIVQLAFVDAAQ